MKKDGKSHSWKNALWSGAIELIFLFSVVAIGLGIMLLFPHEAIKDIPYELFLLLGGIVFLAVSGIIALIVHLVKTKRKTKDLRFIYTALKHKHNLTLMTVTRKINGEMLDILIIKGKSSKGKFELFKDGQVFVFSVECFSKLEGEKSYIAYPQNVNEAIEYIENFMLNKQLPY